MSSKTIIIFGMIIGSIAGGYLPYFFGVNSFSFVSLLTSAIGAVTGIWVAYKITH